MAFYLTYILTFYLALYLTYILAFYLAFYLTFILAFYLAYILTFYLGVDGRGLGPAGNTWRRWSRLRSGREHLAWMVAVEVRQGTLGVDGRG